MKYLKWLIVLTLLAFAGCSTSDDNLESEHTVIRTLSFDMVESLVMLGGTSVTFPALTYSERAIVIVSDLFTGTDGSTAYFPTLQQLPEDLIGAVVINTPADKMLDRNLDVRFELRDFSSTASAVPGVNPGAEYAVYRFDSDNLNWTRWGNVIATVEANGNYASASLPTDGMLGYVGSLAIFKPNHMGALPLAVGTTIGGIVVDGNGDPVSTDVSLYVLVGAAKHAFPIGNATAFIPAIPDPQDNSQNVNVANAVMSDASGHFTIEVPNNLIGQLVNLSFGLEDGSISGTDEFDVQTPFIVQQFSVTGTEYLDVDYMRIQYGENTVRSQPVS